MLIIIEDLNAKIGREKFVKEVVGRYSLHDIMRTDTGYTYSFATGHKMWTSSILFSHKNIHKQD